MISVFFQDTGKDFSEKGIIFNYQDLFSQLELRKEGVGKIDLTKIQNNIMRVNEFAF